MEDLVYKHLWQQAKIPNSHEQQMGYEINVEKLMICRKRIYVPNQEHLKILILDEYHKVPYAGHPGYKKLITTIRKEYFEPSMMKEVAKYLARYLECQQVKTEHRHPAGLLHPLPILEWKWEVISINFIIGLPKSKMKNDSIIVVIDK